MVWSLWLAAQTTPVVTDTGDLEFLAGQAALGNLVIVRGTTSTTATVVTSYTPANGKTFYIYQASYSIYNVSAGNTGQIDLRNNGTIRETKVVIPQSAVGEVAGSGNFSTKGDQLVGNGAKTYDTLWTLSAGTGTAFAMIEGYIQ